MTTSDGTAVCLSLPMAFGFCGSTAAAFVGSLYLLVPPAVRALDRNHPRHIQWRTGATGCVCIAAYAASRYYLWPCNEDAVMAFQQNHGSLSSFAWHALKASAKVLAHVAILYTGPILQGVALVATMSSQRSNFRPIRFIKALYGYHVEPTIRSLTFGDVHGWITWRNLVLAPTLEEVAFRTCMVSVLLAAGIGVNTVCWTSPLFFGVAHVHHAVQRFRQERTTLARVAIQTTFQFAYTTLFGAYAAYAYIHTQSTIAVALLHGFCNWMGLPNFLFSHQEHVLYNYRRELLMGHLIGLACFGTALFRGFLHSSLP